MTAQNEFIKEFELLQKKQMEWDIYISRMETLAYEIDSFIDHNYSYNEYNTDEVCKLHDVSVKAHNIVKRQG